MFPADSPPRRYIKYFTGIAHVPVLPNYCGYTRVTYAPKRPAILVGPGRGITEGREEGEEEPQHPGKPAAERLERLVSKLKRNLHAISKMRLFPFRGGVSFALRRMREFAFGPL